MAHIALDRQPDAKTRRYDRQLRLWAATGQNALEQSRILVIGASATSTSILKNLVLPGIGHFTIVDHRNVTAEDAGNNFFFEGPSSIGKNRAQEAMRLLKELNDGVEGVAQTEDFATILDKNAYWILGFSLIIAHNLEAAQLKKLAALLWHNSDPNPPILVVVNSAGFLGEFAIQYHEHTIIETHSDTAPSLRIDKAFPALLEYATSLDFASMDPTDHSHVPYVVILVRALENWKKAHDGKPPQTSEEKKAFKAAVLDMRLKYDEENFEEAEAQAYRAWTTTKVPSEIAELFSDPMVANLTPEHPPFWHLVDALRQFSEQPPHTLPLSSTLPDMKANTSSYIHLQKLYKTRAEEEKEIFKSFLKVPIDNTLVDTFVKNCHAIKVLRGKHWGQLDIDAAALAETLVANPKPAATHLGLAALRRLNHKGTPVDAETLTESAKFLLPIDTELPEEWNDVVGELARTPTADLPNTAAFLGGLVAQEIIKMITKQYVPLNGICVVDLIETWTAMI